MANWDKIYREANKLQEQADELFLQADNGRCDFVAVTGNFNAERRCNRDDLHPGYHHLDNHES